MELIGLRIVDMAKTINGCNLYQIMYWAMCPFCEAGAIAVCDECLGTDLDPIPWAELFKEGRREGSGYGRPGRDRLI